MSVTWGGQPDSPSCVYDPVERTVEATLAITGTAVEPDELTVTVTAYADEDTSDTVGSSSRTVAVEGDVDQALVLTIATDRTPLMDPDGETLCRLDVDSDQAVGRDR